MSEYSTGLRKHLLGINDRGAKKRATGWLAAGKLFLRIAVVTVCTVAAITGCGTGTISFDGGHIPTGGASGISKVSGMAFVAEDTSIPVANATVTVTNTALTGLNKSQTVQTGKDGSFVFSSVSNPYAVSRFQVVVTPPAGSNRLPQQISFPLDAGASASVMLALPSTGFDQTAPAKVAVSPATYTLHSGDAVQFIGSVLDAGGNVLPVSPSLVFIGTFGTLQPDGLFTSTSTGTGTIEAFWDTGSALLSGSAAITANTQTVHQPPPPPVVLPTTKNSFSPGIK